MDLFYFLYLFLFFPFCLGRLNEEDSLSSNELKSGSQCFHEPLASCPTPEDKCLCKPLNKHAVVCCNVNAFVLKEGLACANVTSSGPVTELHIRNATLDVLNITWPEWRRLRSLSITDGKINRVAGEFGKYSSIMCLNLSSNMIGEFQDRALVNLYNLTILDLSNNNLSYIPRFRKEGMVSIDVSENKPLLCTNLYDTLDMLKKTNVQFNNKNNTYCFSTTNSFQWFSSAALVPFSQIETIHKVREECVSNCTCEPHRLQILPGKLPTFSVLVNCSNLHLTSLPSHLPPNTVALNISNNNITSLDFSEDPTYENLIELHADNNQITSIVPLEGTKFLSSFHSLSLRNNKVKSLPLYILSDIFDRNDNNHYINLGLNKLHCDCNAAKVLKGWIISKLKHIRDYEEIYCNNIKSRVIDLDVSKLCQSQHDWTDYIYYIITAEVLLLVFLITKVSYDYWVFKTAGYLPWPASKMPKLPCDWLCV